jgi:NADPH-dependent curcumin reductase CurA
MLDAVLLNMKLFGRISVCGMISQFIGQKGEAIYNLSQVIPKRIRIQGFIMHDHYHLREEFHKKVAGYLREGKIIYMEDFMDGLENAPVAFIRLLEGKNVGKQIVRL